MKRLILVDGNNLLFRSYYATAYTGNLMKNSKNFPTNALYGFVNMINKIIAEEKPVYMMVAFDIGVNFRKKENPTYKEGRQETPDDLKKQMPLAREILTKMGIKYYEQEPYEADDIIGTFAKKALEDPEFDATIISSDKDLLQLINEEVNVKLLKQKDYIYYDEATFKKDYGFPPINMIDYKALAGDPSDNIPGVKGIGDKTAITLLKEYQTIENIYDNIEKIKGKVKEKLLNDKESAFLSKKLATIYCDVPIDTNFDNIKYLGPDEEALYEIYRELEFYSLIKNFSHQPKKELNLNYTYLTNVDNLIINNNYSVYIECSEENYHNGHIINVAICDKDHNYLIAPEILKEVINKIKHLPSYTYDLKKNLILLRKLGIDFQNCVFDLLISSYLLNYNTKNEDIAYLMNAKNLEIPFLSEIYKREVNSKYTIMKCRFIYEEKDNHLKNIKLEDMEELFYDIEMPLVEVLADMEYTGIKVERKVLEEMKVSISNQIESTKQEIYLLAGEEFNISSPKQLGTILFEKLNLPYSKKSSKDNYKTDVNVLQKLSKIHPIINKILTYRNLTKIYSTYLEGLINTIKEDGKIHTIYKQTLTRTGRLSSVEPNLQNIPAHDDLAKQIRKAFVPEKDIFLSCDYSQIELRILAHISNSKELIAAFINNQDIHRKVAADIYGKDFKDVTKEERSTAKAVIFGIVYGISGYGLGTDLGISTKEAAAFINKYYELYPGVKNYMDNIIKEAYEYGYVKTLYNRKRIIEELNNKNYMIRSAGERIALNTPIQGTAADIIKKAMVLIYLEFKKENIKSKMLLQVHDELVFDCLNEEKEKVLNIVKDKMENVIKLSVPIIISSDYGTNWYDAK